MLFIYLDLTMSVLKKGTKVSLDHHAGKSWEHKGNNAGLTEDHYLQLLY